MERHAPGVNGRIFNDLLHDLSAGVFPGAVIGAWVVRNAAEVVSPGTGAVVEQSSGRLWLVLLGVLGVHVWTGLLRLRYWRLNVRSGFMESKQLMAVIKHAAFVTVQALAALALALL